MKSSRRPKSLRDPRRSSVYAIADLDALGSQSLFDAVRAMATAGVGWVQIRAKNASGEDTYRAVESALRALEGSPCELWLDDRVDVASLLPVDGVHLGQNDLPTARAREILGEDVWIGKSTHDGKQFREADEDASVDVIALGPIFETTSKANPEPAVGLSLLEQRASGTRKPVVAIGGLHAGNLRPVLEAGADKVALLGAVCRGDVLENSLRLVAAAGRAQ